MYYDIYALGNALMDIQVQVSDSTLADLDVTKGNMYLTERERQQQVLHALCPDRMQIAAGGSAANTVFDIARLGGRGALCGKVGQDQFGTRYLAQTRQGGISFAAVQAAGTTGTCVVLLTPDAQRTMLTCLGVSGQLTPADIDPGQLAASAFVYIEGYLFDTPQATETILHAIGLAKQAGVRIALSASDALCVGRHHDLMTRLVRQEIDLLFANTDEALALTGAPNMVEAGRQLAARGTDYAITDGAHGSLVRIGNRQARISACPVTAVDTTGAGDAYAAGLLYGLARALPLDRCGRIASAVAAQVVAQTEPRYCGPLATAL